MCELMNEPSVLKIDFTVHIQHVIGVFYDAHFAYITCGSFYESIECRIADCRELQKPNEINEIAKNKKIV